MPEFIVAWKMTPRPARCSRCKARVQWVIRQDGRKLPLEWTAEPVGEVIIDGLTRARFVRYLPEASHLWHCPAKKPTNSR